MSSVSCSSAITVVWSLFRACFLANTDRFLVHPKTIVFGRTYVLAQMFYFYLLQREISEMRGPTGVKFCTMVINRPSFIMPVQNFGGRTPKNFGGEKHGKFGPISDDFKVRRRISPKQMKIFKFGFCSVYRDSSRVRRNKSGEVWSSDLGDLDVESYPPKVHFSEDHILAPRGCCAPKFLHALENDQVLLAHPPPGTVAPLQLLGALPP